MTPDYYYKSVPLITTHVYRLADFVNKSDRHVADDAVVGCAGVGDHYRKHRHVSEAFLYYGSNWLLYRAEPGTRNLQGHDPSLRFCRIELQRRAAGETNRAD